MPKAHRSDTRKIISFLGKTVLVCMGEPLPSSQDPVSHSPAKKNRPLFWKIFVFLLQIPLFFLSLKPEKSARQKRSEEENSLMRRAIIDPSLIDSLPPKRD